MIMDGPNIPLHSSTFRPELAIEFYTIFTVTFVAMVYLTITTP